MNFLYVMGRKPEALRYGLRLTNILVRILFFE